MSQPRRMLVLACSAAKRPGEGCAIGIYDGPAFRVLAAYRLPWSAPGSAGA